jgi:uncharacterized protein involved in exopolysaccharide biosynthesis
MRGLSSEMQFNMTNLIKSESLEEVKKAKKILEKSELNYMANVPKKWMVFTVGVFIGILLGIAVP